MKFLKTASTEPVAQTPSTLTSIVMSVASPVMREPPTLRSTISKFNLAGLSDKPKGLTSTAGPYSAALTFRSAFAAGFGSKAMTLWKCRAKKTVWLPMFAPTSSAVESRGNWGNTSRAKASKWRHS